MSTAAEAPSETVDRRMGFPSAAILLREAARSSRQWRTYAARVAFSGALISIVLLAIALGTTAIAWTDPGTWGETGRKIFVGFAAVVGLAAVVDLGALVGFGAALGLRVLAPDVLVR